MLAAPKIPAMRGQVILLAELAGQDLETVVAYDGMKAGDTVFIHWRGRSVDGQAFDEVDSEYTLPSDQPLTVTVSNAALMAINGGDAFYSYGVIDAAGGSEVESLRLLCFINHPAGAAVDLPVANIIESHDLHVNVNNVPISGANVVIAPYQAMAAGDKVTLRWQGYRSADDSKPATPYTRTVTLSADQVGQPVDILLPKTQLRNFDGFHADLSYDVQYGSQGASSQATVQRFEIKAPSTAHLQPPTIDGFSGGELDPDQYPNGIPVCCPLYPNLLAGDRLWLCWQGTREMLIEQRYVDPSIVDSQKLVFITPGQEVRQLGSGQVSWQYSRAGEALTSDPLPFTIRTLLKLPMPAVEGVSQEAGAPMDEGYLRPEAISSAAGAYITIPDAAEYSGASVAVHWLGHDPGGRTIIQRPVSTSEPRKFRVPPEFVAANMGDDESKRFHVFYRATLNGLYQDSPAYKLLIRAPDPSMLPQLECKEANNGSLSKAAARSGATLELGRWVLMAQGQQLTIEAEGGPQPWECNQVLTATDVIKPRVSTILPANYISALGVGTQLTLNVRVSFDSGATSIAFPLLRLRIAA